MSTLNPPYGKKVNDPNAPPIVEGAGVVTPDSLAAESTRQGGKFAENRNNEPQDVSGPNSTVANENTSEAKRLDPAPYAQAREPDEDWVEEKNSGAGSSHPDSTGEQRGSSGNNTGGSSKAGVAPTYVISQYLNTGKTKGKDLHEGGFESHDANNASFNSDIGSKDDPSRLAEQRFRTHNAVYDVNNALPRQESAPVDNAYETLKRDASA
ncbi:hypothetical protein BKA64DRAFT_422042 [Cadophora sp. MPI-SDFR-AT-0126]|nr:hypothetical protein BKA64DRAFT_422042 [Leotiomycetes sp. MPI-SDFR-AT-0126]